MKGYQYWLCFVSLLFSEFLCAQSVGGTTSGAAFYCDSINSGFISLSNYNGLILYWEESTDGQVTWQQIQNTTSTQSYNQLNKTTAFRAIVQDGTFPTDTSTAAIITVHVPGVAGSISGGGTFCSGANSGALVLANTQGTVVMWQSLEASGQWQNISNTTYTYSFVNLIKSAQYRAVVQRVPGCDADTSAKTGIVIDPMSVSGSLTGSDSLCYGSPADTILLSGELGNDLQWLSSIDGGQTWDTIQNGGTHYIYPEVKTTTWYVVAVKNGVCFADTTAPAIVMSHPRIIADAGPDMTITRRESVQMQAQASSGAVIEWNPSTGLSDTISIAPTATPKKTITYELVVTAETGCVARDSVIITVIIPLPTAFTPNGDGVNDNFEIYQVENFPGNVLDVYDRWGNLVFHASPYTNNWEGRSSDNAELPESTYYYRFDYGPGEKSVTGYVLIKR